MLIESTELHNSYVTCMFDLIHQYEMYVFVFLVALSPQKEPVEVGMMMEMVVKRKMMGLKW